MASCVFLFGFTRSELPFFWTGRLLLYAGTCVEELEPWYPRTPNLLIEVVMLNLFGG